MSQDKIGLPRGRPIVEHVNSILKAKKTFVGTPEYRSPNRYSEQVRLVWPVLINKQSDHCYVAVTLYPNDCGLRFTICLVYYDRNIWRLDFEPMDRVEINPGLDGNEYSLATIQGPHCHRWEENRLFATRYAIPEPLPFRIPLPREVQTWDNAFRHFAGATNIDQPVEVPPWPARENLL